MTSFDRDAYGPECRKVFERDGLCKLGPGSPDERYRGALAALTIASLAPSRPIVDSRMAQCCLAGLWLLHDFLDESHRISQQISSTSGSYWHGIMHRREPDYSNAKYWFRRVGEHPIFPQICSEAAEIAAAEPSLQQTEFLREQSRWDPLQFIDLCELANANASGVQQICRQVAQREWQLLFDYCYRQAIGG